MAPRPRHPGHRGRGAGPRSTPRRASSSSSRSWHAAGPQLRLRRAQGPYLPRIVSGESQGSYCLSEADAGSRRRSMTSGPCATATAGCCPARKCWITNAGISDLYTVFAKTDPAAGHRGITAFVVEKDWGVQIGKLEHKLGVQGLAHRRGPARRGAGPGREPDRRGRPRLLLRHEHARPQPPDHRRAGRRHRAGRARRRRGAT